MGSTRGSYSRCVKGMPRPGETDSYVRSCDPRRGAAEVVDEDHDGDSRTWVVRLPEALRYDQGRKSCRHIAVMFSAGGTGCRTLAMPSTPHGSVRSWEVLAESRLMSPEAAMRDCLRQLGWEVEGRGEARDGR